MFCEALDNGVASEAPGNIARANREWNALVARNVRRSLHFGRA